MLTADTQVELGLGGTTLAACHLDELANAFLIENLERVNLQDAQVLVDGEELASVITRVTKGHLGQVVGTEREEVYHLCDLVGNEGGTRNLNHGTYLVGNGLTALGKYLLSNAVDDVGLHLDLVLHTNQGNHDLGVNVDALSLHVESGLDDSAGLHLGDFGIGVAQTAATVTQHGVELFQTVANELHLVEGAARLFGELTHGLELMGNELVQGGIEQANGHFIAVHGLEDALEVATLQREQLGQGNAT